jgi:hypothetical protein
MMTTKCSSKQYTASKKKVRRNEMNQMIMPAKVVPKIEIGMNVRDDAVARV